jgi:acetyl esterase/lipase
VALDEATAALVARSAGDPKPPGVPVLELRALRRAAAVRIAPGRVTDTVIPVAGGTIPARVIRPGPPPRGVIVYYHAGGWVLGGLDECEAEAGALAECTGCVVVCPSYRLAPEYRYPTAVEDAWTALRWAAASSALITGGPAGPPSLPLIVAGASAGGNLAAVVARRSAERGGPQVLQQVLIYPVTDSDTGSLSYTDPANQLLLDRDEMIWFWDQYVPDPAARRHPDASPLQAVFFNGVPPAVILTAEHDVLRDEGELYAMRLVQAGIPVEHRRFTGQIHGFLGRIGVLPGSADGLRYIAGHVETALAALPGQISGKPSRRRR